MRQAPNAGALDKYSVNSAQGKDVIYQPMYDYINVPLGIMDTVYTFFQNPVGQAGKTLQDTNMESAGSLPEPQLFIVEAISVDFFSDSPVEATTFNAWQDTYDFMRTGVLDFTVGSKSRLQQSPMGAFPSPYRLGGAMAAGGTNIGEYASMAGQMFSIIPVTLPANQNFNVKLMFPSNPPALRDSARIGVKLHGSLFRSVQ